MAGFMAPLAQWEVIEAAVHKIMSDYHVDVFHAKEFNDTKRVFADWSMLKKRTFVNEVFSAAHGRMYGLSVTIGKNEFLATQKTTGKFSEMSPYGVCFSAILVRAVTDPQIGQAVKKEGISFLVESGNTNNAEIERYFHKMSKMPIFEGCLCSISFISKQSCRAIQVADFFAFYTRREMRDQARFFGKLALPPIPYLEIIEKHMPVWQKGGFRRPVLTGKQLADLPNLDALRDVAKNH